MKPVWAERSVVSIAPSEVQAWGSGLDRSISLVLHAYAVLSQSLDVAVGDRALKVNPARGVRLSLKSKT
ncbi:hypothetical protein GCM10028828_15870 [Corynebacterium tapiri]